MNISTTNARASGALILNLDTANSESRLSKLELCFVCFAIFCSYFGGLRCVERVGNLISNLGVHTCFVEVERLSYWHVSRDRYATSLLFSAIFAVKRHFFSIKFT